MQIISFFLNLKHNLTTIPLLFKKALTWARVFHKNGPFVWKCIHTLTPRQKNCFQFHYLTGWVSVTSLKLSGVTFPLSLWLVLHCICLLTSCFIYWCLAWNHGWHGIPWCKRKRVNILVSLPAAAAPETWISAVNVTQASCWWERTNTLNMEY